MSFLEKYQQFKVIGLSYETMYIQLTLKKALYIALKSNYLYLF